MLRPSYLLAALVVASAVLVARHYGGDSERETSRQLAEAALGRSYQGMPLAEAEQALDDAWHHAACPYQAAARGSIHLFLYGSRDLSKLGIVYLRADGPLDRQVVTFFTREKNERLFMYDRCSPLDFPSPVR
jgi:hypothetical protein